MKDLQAVVLAAVLLSPVALGAGEPEALSSLAQAGRNAAKTFSLKGSGDWIVIWKPDGLAFTSSATLSVWNVNKAARRLLTAREIISRRTNCKGDRRSTPALLVLGSAFGGRRQCSNVRKQRRTM